MKSKIIIVVLITAVSILFLLSDKSYLADIRAYFSKNSESMAISLGTLLTDYNKDAESVKISGDTVIFEPYSLRFQITERIDPDSHSDIIHFHIKTRQFEKESEALEACVIGVGLDKDSKIESAALSFRNLALPVLISKETGEAVDGASSFYGNDEWGVPGFRGFVGPLGIRGDSEAGPFDESMIFSSIAGIPKDGRNHLLKVTLLSEDDGWIRNIEIDGSKKLIVDEKWDKLPSVKDGVVIIQYALIASVDNISNDGRRNAVLVKLEQKPRWLFKDVKCPLDIIPQDLPAAGYNPDACSGGRLQDCIEECEEGYPSSCYNAAIVIQKSGKDDEVAQALFLQACSLGHASGCTNSTAYRLQNKNEDCRFNSFEKICRLSGDPWACTMYGSILIDDGPRQDLVLAREVLKKSCRHDEGDSACIAAKNLLKTIKL